MLLTGYGKHFTGSPSQKNKQDHIFACKNRLYQYILEGLAQEHEHTYQVLKDFTQDGNNFYFAYQQPY